jgi:hypothetical protein
MSVLPSVQQCDHENFYSGQGRYSREKGEIRYVLICDDCQAELRLVGVEHYQPNYDPTGGRQQAA